MPPRRPSPPPTHDRAALEQQIALLTAEMERRGFLPTDDPARPGTMYRIPDELAGPAGVPLPANLCVLTADSTHVTLVPVTLNGTVRAGDIAISPAESPFGYGSMGGLVLHAWCAMRAPRSLLDGLSAHARCPAVEAVSTPMLLAPPPGQAAFVRAWRTLVEGLLPAQTAAG